MGSPELRDAILALLDAAGVPYERRHHPPIRSSRHAAELRGESLELGGKTLLFKTPAGFHLVAVSAARRLDNRAVRHLLGSSKLRFATRDELAELTGLVPGALPPFGEPVLPLPLVADQGLLDQPDIAFTPGLLTESILMRSADWRDLARPSHVAPLSR